MKSKDWETTLFLFQEEYHVPLLSPPLAAWPARRRTGVPGAAGPRLAGRYAALGLSAVNVMAVVSYAHVLLAEGFEAALGQHHLWGFMLLVVAVFGPGPLSADAWLKASGVEPGTNVRYRTERPGRERYLDTAGVHLARSNRSAPVANKKGTYMNRLIYIIGAIVVIVAVLSFFGLR